MDRRDFLAVSTLGGASLMSPFQLSFAGQAKPPLVSQASDFKALVSGLLKDWCDGMIKHQVVDVSQPKLHGSLWCPACQKIHGRCMDAVYPFMHMAHKTGDKKYLDAAILSMEWSKNVTKEDGSWTVIPNPKSWAGITVFGAIALAESLHYHSEILPPEIDKAWRVRLAKAADYIFKNFDLEFTNINYGGTAIYALNLIGRELNQQKFIDRSHQLASGIKAYFTQPNKLLFGEGKPSQSKSAKGLLPVDLGYNVEETLNALVMYALHENDQTLLALLSESLAAHAEFILPDGAWDNSWGTRHAKWSYWGSRTTDGSQPAFGLMAHINPVLGSAAYLNTELLANCTAEGLLHGGPHYVSHGVLPCIHHTFAHAKPLAFMLDHGKALKYITKQHPVPRETEYGVKHFSELDVWLVSHGNWRATVSSYDSLYKEGKQEIQQATGGSLGMVWHELTGPLMVASMPKYYMVEVNNQQPQPDGEDIALTPRVESYNQNGEWFTNLYDLTAKVSAKHTLEEVNFDIQAQVKNAQSDFLSTNGQSFNLTYKFSKDKLNIAVSRSAEASESEKMSRLVLPIVAKIDEKVTLLDTNRVAVVKPKGVVLIESNVPLTLRKTIKSRTFNMVPGMEAVVIDITLPRNTKQAVNCSITVNA